MKRNSELEMVTISLSKVCRIDSGAGFPLEYQGQKNQTFPFFKVGDMNAPGNERTMRVYEHSISDDIRRKLKAKVFPPGTVVFPKIGAAIATNKKRIIERPACVDNNVMAVVPLRDIEPDYLYYLFLNKDLNDFANPGNPPSIRKTIVETWGIPIPPLPEQQRIADILSRADRLRRLRRFALEMSEGYLQAVFLEMFGEQLRNANQSTEMGKLVTITGGGTPSREIERYYTGDIPWLTSKDMRGDYIWDTQEHITKEAIAKSATKLVPAGSILVVVKSKILMRRLPLALTMRPMCHGQDIKSIQCSDQLDPVFLIQVMKYNEDSLLAKARGANTEGLNLPMLREIPVPNVPLSDQQEFVRVVEGFRRLRAQQREALRQAEHLFQGLLQAAFRGELTPPLPSPPPAAALGEGAGGF